MSVATFFRDLKIFRPDDDYSSPVSVPLSTSQISGRISWSGDGKWLSVAPLEQDGGPLPILRYSDKQIHPLKYITLSNITSACFFNWTNRNIAVGKNTGEVFVWDIKEKKIGIKVDFVEKQPVDFIAVNSEDAYLASGSLASNKISIHGLKTNKVVNTIAIPKSSSSSSLKFCMCKKNFLGMSSIESTICVWDLVRSDFIFKMLNSHSGACTDISFSPINSDVIASVSLTKTLRIYDLRDRKVIFDTNIGEPMNCVDIILNGDKVALGTTKGNVIIYDLRGDKVFHTFKAHDGPISSVKTQSLKIPKSYQEVDMNTPDVVDKPSKTLDISVMDLFSPIANSAMYNSGYNQSKSDGCSSTPRLAVQDCNDYEDSFLQNMLSPKPANDLVPNSQSSPYLIPEKPALEQTDLNLSKNIKEKPVSVVNACDGGGDGFNVDNTTERNLYYSDIISEIRNSQKEVLNEISLIREEVHNIKKDFDSKYKILQESCETLTNLLLGDIKQEIYAGNCDSKIEHISHRILMNELNDAILTNREKISEEIKLNGLKLKHIFEMLNGIKLG